MRENREMWPSKSPTTKKLLENIAIEHRSTIFELVRDPELQNVINTFDLNLLSDNLRVVAAKSGVNPETLHVVPIEHIVGLADDGKYSAAGTYSPAGNIITLNRKTLEHNNESEGLSFLAGAIRTIIHEQVHAASFTLVDERYNPETGKPQAQIHSGYSRTITNYKEGKPKSFFELFEEGVTDKLAIEQTLRYAQTHPEILTAQDKVILSKIVPPPGPYTEAMLLVSYLAFFMSQEAGVSSETIWHAIVAGKINGDGLFEPEVKEWFDKNISPDFLLKLEQEENEEGIESLIDEVFGKHKEFLLKKALGTETTA